ncbi:MAG: ABC transporter permease [Alphaproteobacteria bacterium]|nr:ABC transporter permease [Alphaproteobacteria bacterium]
MFKSLTIIWIGFLLALRELWLNKVRTFLSLFGITIGIFCIIGVLALVDSLERKVQNDVSSLGENTIYIDKWLYSGDDDNYPWWKYIKRPEPKIKELDFIKQKSKFLSQGAFYVNESCNLSYFQHALKRVQTYGISENFNNIESFDIGNGLYFNDAHFKYGSAVCVIGYDLAIDLFGSATTAYQKTVNINNKKVVVIGILKKIGQSFIGGFDFDHSVLLPINYFESFYSLRYSNPVILIKGKPNVSSSALKFELTGIMRQIRKLKPTQEDDFSCNNVSDFSQIIEGFFGKVNVGGWAIAGLSLLVGAFGIANIMFVTVRERRSQIGLKKALGATKKVIMFEFLFESAFLCVLGGFFGLLLVWMLTFILNTVLPFQIFVALPIVVLAFSICVILGMVAGFIPASQAANLDPVVAIRSTS